jgi:acyl-CoA synthetase (AMP-forming)/AMP-acid ligase II
MVSAEMRLSIPTRLEAAIVLAQRGLLRPTRPDKLVREGLAFWRWGSSMAAAYTIRAIDSPNRTALITDDRERTYAEIDKRTNALARGLAELGVREADRVGLLCRNGSEFVESVVACSKLGADVLLVNTSFSPSELDKVLKRDRPRLVIHDAEFTELVEQGGVADAQTVIGRPGDGDSSLPSLEDMSTTGSTEPLDPPEHESRSVVLTSGTTGTPKGARIARPENIEPLAWMLRRVPLNAGSTYLISAPMFHAHGYGQFSGGAGLGCTLALPSRFHPEEALAAIEEHRIEAWAVVPVMLKRVMELPAHVRTGYDTSSLRIVLSSGSALPAGLSTSFMDAFGPVLYNLYGSTEVAWATIATPEDLVAAPGTAGRPPPHTRLEILDKDGRRLPPGETGLIFVGHEMLFEGYTDGSRRDTVDGGLMTAGDVGHLDKDGRLFVDSRQDDMIVSGGENVYPGEVEAILGEHPGVEEIAVVGVDDEQFGQRLVAFAVVRPDGVLTDEDLRAYAKENLARYKVPREVRLMEELPRNALGKVLKKKLREELGT